MSLSHFRELASNDETVRLKAAYSLLSELSSGGAEAIEYALNRLIRGLASGRESSRIGFSIALTEAGVPAEFLFRRNY
jgi:DNA polymerase phi